MSKKLPEKGKFIRISERAPKTVREDVLLRNKLRTESEGAAKGFKEGYNVAKERIGGILRTRFATAIENQKTKYTSALENQKAVENMAKEVRADIVNFAKENLPIKSRGKFLLMVSKARSQKDLIKAFTRIDIEIDNVLKRELISEISKKMEMAKNNNAIDIGYAQQIKDLMDGFELKGHNKATIDRLIATEEYLIREAEKGLNPEMPREILDAIKILYRTPKELITTDILAALDQKIGDLLETGKMKLTTKEGIYELRKANIADRLEETAIKIGKSLVPRKFDENVSIVNRALDSIRKSINAYEKKRLVLRPMNGVVRVTGMEDVKNALDFDFSGFLNHELRTTVMDEFVSLNKKLKLNDINKRRIGVYAARMQDGGYEKLENLGISAEDANRVVLTAQEQEYYDFVTGVFKKWYPDVKEYMKDVYNQEVGEVNNYVPFITDFDEMSDILVQERFGDYARNAVTRTKTVEKGFTTARTGAGKQKIELNIDDIFKNHVDNVAYMLTMGKDIKMYFEILNTPRMRTAMGETSNIAWLEYLDLMARKGGASGANQVRMLDIIRKNMGAAVFPFKLSSAAVQLTSLADGASVIGGDWMYRGAMDITKKEWREFIMKNFPEIRAAVGDDPAFIEMGEGWLKKTTKVGMSPMVKLDLMARMTTAAGAYSKLMKDAGKTVDLARPDKAIVQQAQKMVTVSQGSSLWKEQPLAISKGKLTGSRSFDRAILQFQSFMLNRWDNIENQIWTSGLRKKDYKQAANGIFWLVLVATAMETGIRKGVNSVISAATTSDNTDDDSYLKSMALNTLDAVPLMGSMFNSFIYNTNPVPMIQSFESLFGGIASVATAKSDTSKLKGLTKAMAGIGQMLGIPGTSQTKEIITRMLSGKKDSKESSKGPKRKALKLKPTPKLKPSPSQR